MVTRLRSGSLGLLHTKYMPYAPSPQLPSHKIMPSTCQTIHYDASQYRVYIYQFTIFHLQYQVLLRSIPASLARFPHSSLAPLFARLLPPFPSPPSYARLVPHFFPSLRPCLVSSLPRSSRSRRDTYVGF